LLLKAANGRAGLRSHDDVKESCRCLLALMDCLQGLGRSGTEQRHEENKAKTGAHEYKHPLFWSKAGGFGPVDFARADVRPSAEIDVIPA
jgi:hypothetical protein